ncbi:MAG: NAD(P)H-hydrate dehydratase [Clostridia bacterium]|nr:NAD(P)H-hydrate dehydratase [Clostridia bacterium]
MITVLPCQISLIDTYAEKTLGIPTRELMRRAGLGVAKEIEKRCKKGRVLLFCGGGNNGGDGYAAALFLGASGFSPLAVDVFGKGQKSEAGKFFLEEYTRIYGKPLSLSDALLEEGATVLVDAVFGTGFGGELPREASLLEAYYKKSTAYKVAVDMPLGVDGEKGVCRDVCLFADLTVALCFVKQGMLSYPAKDACGEIALCDLGLDQRSIQTVFSLPETVDEENIAALLPKRKTNTHKGSFGKVLGFVGSRQYKGAALLSAEGALRMGAGLFVLASAQEVIDVALLRLPECLTLPLPDTEELTEADFAKLFKEAARASAILVGCGSGKSHNLQTILYNLLQQEGAPLVIDADGLNVLAEDRKKTRNAFIHAKREVVITPHPLEFARLIGKTAEEVQANRLPYAQDASREWGVTVVLKGAATVVATKGALSVSTSGSNALAKGGSGDVLAGMLAALLAQGASLYDAARAAVFLHGRAAESLEKELSSYGVLPSDLPTRAARLLADFVSQRKKTVE